MYKLVGIIRKFDDIPFDKQIIIAGSINGQEAWFHYMPGTFKKDNDDYRFVNVHGMPTRFGKETPIALSVLEKE